MKFLQKRETIKVQKDLQNKFFSYPCRLESLQRFTRIYKALKKQYPVDVIVSWMFSEL